MSEVAKLTTTLLHDVGTSNLPAEQQAEAMVQMVAAFAMFLTLQCGRPRLDALMLVDCMLRDVRNEVESDFDNVAAKYYRPEHIQ